MEKINKGRLAKAGAGERCCARAGTNNPNTPPATNTYLIYETFRARRYVRIQSRHGEEIVVSKDLEANK